jgi:hypothetical protein
MCGMGKDEEAGLMGNHQSSEHSFDIDVCLIFSMKSTYTSTSTRAFLRNTLLASNTFRLDVRWFWYNARAT